MNSFNMRHAISVGLAVFLAAMVSAYGAFGNGFWVVISAFLVCQTTRGAPLRQGLIKLMQIVAAICVAYVLRAFVYNTVIVYSLLIVFFVFFRFFSITLIIATLAPIQVVMLTYAGLMDAVYGGVIGIVINQFIFPVQLYKEFSMAVRPLLMSLSKQAESVTERFLQFPDLPIENMKNNTAHLFPEWVYDVGFNPGLRAGFRYFLVTVDRIEEAVCAMRFLCLKPVEMNALQPLAIAISNVGEKNQILFNMLIHYFKEGILQDVHMDLTSDIEDLEQALQGVVPNNLELLDLSPDYMALTGFVRNMKDIRELLLQLAVSLPVMKAA